MILRLHLLFLFWVLIFKLFINFKKLRRPFLFLISSAGPEKAETVLNFERLTEISGRLHHVDMTTTFLKVVAVIGKSPTSLKFNDSLTEA